MKTSSDKKNRFPEGDDGRTIVNMNVDGMPWYTPREKTGENPDGNKPWNDRKGNDVALSKQESRYYTWGALKAALLVVGVICAGIVLFILFCVYVWFR